MLERLKDTFDKSVAAVSVKSESLVESSRVKTAISSTQRSMDSLFNALGIKVYNSWASSGIDPAVLEEDCKQINDLNVEITNLKNRLEQIKAEESQILGAQQRKAAPAAPAAAAAPSASASGSVFCTNCGKRLEAGARFCDECGTPVK